MSAITRSSSIKGSLNVLTGCASGLGRATLCWLLKHGSGPILAIDRQFEQNFLETLELDRNQVANITLREHDNFDEKEVEKSLDEFTARHKTIDNLINVAGVALGYTLYTAKNQQTYKLSHANDLLKFNTVGTFNMIRLASRYMIESNDSNKSKCIINTSCISTSKPSVGQSFYAATNSSLDSLTLVVAREFAPHNIRCNTINVGYFDTKLLRSSDEKVCNYLTKYAALCPRRLGHPDEFAHLVQATIENQMLNGACIKLDACAEPALERMYGRSLV